MTLLRRIRRHGADDLEERFQIYWNLAGIPGLIAQNASGSAELEEALMNAASWACIDVISDALGRTPLDAFRGDKVSIPVVPVPRVLDKPSSIVLRDVWRYQLGFALATDGNAFGQITGLTGAGYPTGIEWFNPAAVTKRKVVDGIAQVEIERIVHRLYPDGDIFHIPGRMIQPGTPFALSTVEYAGRNSRMSLSAEKFSNDFFTGGGHPDAILKAKTNLTNEQALSIKGAVRQALSGNSREPLVLSDMIDWQQIQSDPSNTQFIDVMRFCCEQASRFWHVPPAMIFAAVSGQNVTYSSVSDADLNLLKYTLDGYWVRIETALTECIPRPQYVKVNRNAVLRGDPLNQIDYITKAIATRTMTPNEARALLEMPPITDGTGDQFYGPVAPGRAEPQVPGDAPATVPTPTTQPAMPSGNGKGMK